MSEMFVTHQQYQEYIAEQRYRRQAAAMVAPKPEDFALEVKGR